MARRSEGPRYYKSKMGWFANLDGDRIRLTTGPKKQTKKLAQEKYQAELEARRVEVAGDRNTVWAVLNAYLSDCQNKVENDDMAESTLKMHTLVLKAFNEACGTIIVRQLRPQHVTDWLSQMRQPRWNEKLKRMVKWRDATVKLGRDVLLSPALTKTLSCRYGYSRFLEEGNQPFMLELQVDQSHDYMVP